MATTVVTAKFVADTSDLAAKLGAAQAQIQGFATRMSGAGEKMVAMGRSMAGISLPLAAIGGLAVKTAMDFDSSMTKMVTLVGLTREEVDGMSNDIRKMAVQYGKSATEAADAMFFIQSAGLRGADAMDTLEASLMASRMGLGEVKTIADLTTSALNAYGSENLSATQATAHLHAAVREGKLEASELAGAMGAVLPVASAMGVSFGEVAGMMAGMSRTGTNASQATTQLRGILNSILKPTQQAERALQGMGLSSEGLRQQIREKGLLSVLQTLKEQFGDNTAATADVFGNVRALSGVLDLMGESADANADIIGSVMNASLEDFREASEIAGETAQAKFNTAMAAMRDALLDIGIIILPIASQIMEFTASIAQAFQKIPGPVQTVIVSLGGIVALAGPLLWMAGGVIKGLAGMMLAFTAMNTRIGLAAVGFARAMTRMALAARGTMDTIRLQFMLGGVSIKTFGALAKTAGATAVAAFRTIGLAAKTLMASLGPIGLAIAGVSVAMGVMMSRSAEAEAKIDSLRETVDETTGAFTDLTASMIAEKLTLDLDPVSIIALERAGITVADMTVAIIEGGDAVDEIGRKFNDAIPPTSRYQAIVGNVSPLVRAERAFGGAAKQVDQLRGDLVMAETASKNAAAAVARTGGIVQTASDDFGDLADSVDDAASQLDSLNEMFGTFDKNVAAIRARDAATEYMQNLSKNLAKTSRDLEGEGKAARQNRDVVLGAFEAKRKELETWAAQSGASGEEVEREWFKMTQAVRRQLIDEGFTARDLAKFLGEDGIDVASVRVSRELESAVTGIGKSAVSRAEAMGDTIGRQLMNGVTTGIRAGQQRANTASADAARSASDSFQRAAGISSPSKVFAEHGRDLARGIVQGLRSEEDNIAEAAKKAFTDWYEKVEAELEKQVDDVVAIYDDMAGRVRSAVRSALDFSSIAPEINEEGERVGLSFTDALQEQANRATRFAERIGELVTAGLRPAAISEVLKAGVDAGTAIADELIDGGAEAIYVTNTLVESMISAADKIATETADAFYKTGVDEAQATLRGFRKEFGKGGPSYNAMQGLMDRLAASMKRETTITVTTVHRSVFESVGLPGRAAGGPVQARRAYVVGEKGPEVFVSSQAGNIIPNHQLGSIPSMGPRGGGGGVGTVINVNISAPALTDPAEIGRQAVEAIRKYERRSGPVFVSA